MIVGVSVGGGGHRGATLRARTASRTMDGIAARFLLAPQRAAAAWRLAPCFCSRISCPSRHYPQKTHCTQRFRRARGTLARKT